MRTICRTLVLVVALAGSAARGQDAPASLPATQPRNVAQVPPGFTRVEIEGRTFFVMPADQQWGAQAVQDAPPATMPATMPTDLLANLTARRAALRERMAADLGVAPAETDEYLDQRLKMFLERMESLRPPIIYLVASPPQLKEAMKAGWTDRRFHYNRAADDVNYSTTVSLSLEDQADDTVLPLFYGPDDAPDARRRRVAEEMRATEAAILGEVSRRAQSMTMVAMVELISTKALEPLALKPDQEWFGVGVAGVLGARYVALLTGMSEARLLDEMTREDPRNPVRPGTLDLVRPPNMGDVRPEWVNAYADAYRRRAMQVARKLSTTGGEDAIGKVVAAIKQARPADSPALVQLVKQTTGVDLTNDLGPR